ncbi:MAG: biotin--[acetyl-CoA-carboxylase] ligase [Sphingomicrobium sp.]
MPPPRSSSARSAICSSARSAISPTRPQRHCSEAPLSRLRFVQSTGSTNADLLADRASGEGDWLIAQNQSAGRGRQGREWQSLDGNFAGSTLIMLRDGDPPATTLALAAGLALIEAIDIAAPGRRTQLKWPNDVMLDGAKLAGILLERTGDRIVAGFGVNLAAAPDVPDRRTAGLEGVLTAHAFAPLLAASVARLLSAWRSAETIAFIQAWQARAHPVGTNLTVHNAPGEHVTGRFDGLDRDGALRLQLPDGTIQTVRAGDISIFALSNGSAGRD